MLEKLSELHSICFPNKPWSAKDFMELKNSGCEIISGENSFIVYRTFSGEAEIITVGVNPQIRRTGTASAILQIAEMDMKKNGAKSVFLEVAENNQPARAMYKNNGYIEIGIRPKYYDGIDAILMKKELQHE